MHRSHFTGCLIGIALALLLVNLTGSSVGSLGVLLGALACPVGMVLAMKFMSGGTGPHPRDHDTDDYSRSEDAQLRTGDDRNARRADRRAH